MFKVTGPPLPPVAVVVLLSLLLHLSENVGYRWVHSDWVSTLACCKTALVDTCVELLARVRRLYLRSTYDVIFAFDQFTHNSKLPLIPVSVFVPDYHDLADLRMRCLLADSLPMTFS